MNLLGALQRCYVCGIDIQAILDADVDTVERPSGQPETVRPSPLASLQLVEAAMHADPKRLEWSQNGEPVIAHWSVQEHFVDDDRVSRVDQLRDRTMETCQDAPANRTVTDTENRMPILGRQLEILEAEMAIGTAWSSGPTCRDGVEAGVETDEQVGLVEDVLESLAQTRLARGGGAVEKDHFKHFRVPLLGPVCGLFPPLSCPGVEFGKPVMVGLETPQMGAQLPDFQTADRLKEVAIVLRARNLEGIVQGHDVRCHHRRIEARQHETIRQG